MQSPAPTVVIAPGNVTLTISQKPTVHSDRERDAEYRRRDWTLGSAAGTISRSGMYTAPASIPQRTDGGGNRYQALRTEPSAWQAQASL